MFSERFKKLKPYVPGEQPQDREYLKLNTNENPYPPSPKIADFLNGFDISRLRLYSDPSSEGLRNSIAERYEVDKGQVFVSNGSDEALSFCFYAFFDNIYGNLLFPEFTYSFYPVYCDFYGIKYRKIPLMKNYSVDIEGFLNTPDSCGLIFANPNAPTGISLPLERIKFLLENYQKDRVVIIDEAYVDFGGESTLDLLDEFDNLVIVRTFSKSMSLAGLRLGYVISAKKLIDALFVVKDSFNSYPADVLSQLIGKIALSDTEYYNSITKKIISTRNEFSSALKEIGWYVLPSKANFIFAGRKDLTGKDIYKRLKEKGILIRYFDTDGIKDFVRISVGTDEDMERLLTEIKEEF